MTGSGIVDLLRNKQWTVIRQTLGSSKPMSPQMKSRAADSRHYLAPGSEKAYVSVCSFVGTRLVNPLPFCLRVYRKGQRQSR